MINKTIIKLWLKTHKIQLLHSIPGRLRIKIPALDKLPDEFKVYEDKIRDCFLLLPGMKKVEFSYLTSKALIEYEVDRLNEQRVMDWVKHIWDELVKAALDRNQVPSKEEIVEQLDLLKKRLKNDL